MLVSWFLFPIILGATFAGLGLGVRRLAVPFSPALLIPLGYCVSIILAAILSWSGHTTAATGPVIGLLALAGWAASAKDLRRALQGGVLRREWPWMVLGVVAFVVYGAAVLVSGKPSYTGYNEIVDIASQMQWAAHLADFGRVPSSDPSFWMNGINGVNNTGYPAGPWALLGSYPPMFRITTAWAWDPYLSMMAASIAVGAYVLIRQVTDSRAFAAIGAFAVGQASPLIGYGHMGGIKEMSAAATIVAAGAILPTVASSEETPAWRAALPFGIALAGAYSVFSLTILPWLGIFAIGAGLLIWRTVSLRAALIRGAWAAGVFLLVTLPTSSAALDSFGFAKLMEKELGNLANPVSLWSATGVWITSDHRFTLVGPAHTISIAIGVVVIGLALFGLWHAWRKEASALITLWLASIIGLFILLVRMGQWVDFKGMTLAAPVMLLLAVIGLAALASAASRTAMWAGWAGVVGLVAVGIYSDGLRYASTQLAPHDRIMELRHLGNEYYGTPATLIPEWDENASHEMRNANAQQAFNTDFPATPEWEANPARPKPYQYDWDLDQLQPPFTNSKNLIVMRRSPGQSRPGRAFQLREQGRFFNVWERTDAPATVAHLPLTGGFPEDAAKCQALIDTIQDAGTVTIATPPPFVATVLFDQAKTTPGVTVGEGGSFVTFNGLPGETVGTTNLAGRPGLYELYLTAVTHRSVKVTVAGQTLKFITDPSAAVRPQYLGTVSVGGGEETVKVEVGGRTIQPGTGKKYNLAGWVGSVQLIPKGQLYPRLKQMMATQVDCKRPMDWIETP